MTTFVDYAWPEVWKRAADERMIGDDAARWMWTGSRTTSGYGTLTIRGRALRVHRLAWESAHEQAVPDGLHIEHLCENRGCFNPSHLEAVTLWENVIRGSMPIARLRENQRRRDAAHCHRGHEFNEDNTYWFDGRRYCRACHKINAAASHQRKKERVG